MTGTHHPAGIGSGKLTYQDLVDLPEDGKRYEILDGDLVVSASPVTRHQRISRNLEFILHDHVERMGLGEVLDAPIDVILDRHTIVVPDIVYVSKARASIVEERGINGAPDLLIEILSASTSARDRGAKAKLYARFGVDCYWIVDPEKRTVEVYERDGAAYRRSTEHAGDETVTVPPFPDLAIDLAKVWA